MNSIFSPFRDVIHGIVPSLTDTVASSSNINGSTFSVSQNSRHSNASSQNNTTIVCTALEQPVTRPSTSTSSHIRSRSDVSRHSRQASSVEIEIGDSGSHLASTALMQEVPPASNSNNQQERMEFHGAIAWAEKALPFILLLLSRIMWDHRLGILVFIGLFGTFFHVNNTIRKQVALKEKHLNLVLLGILVFLFANTFFIYFVFNFQNLQNCLVLRKPYFSKTDIWTVFWCVVVTDFVVRFVTMTIKCFVIISPRRLIHYRKRGKYFLLIENLSQFYRMLIPIPQWYYYFSNYLEGGEYFAVLSTAVYCLLKCRMLFLQSKQILHAVKCFWKDTRYGRTPTQEVLTDHGDACPICQEEMNDPIELNVCKHIFCEECIVMWFDRERTCPMCRADVVDDPLWRDGSTQSFVQLF